MAIDNLSITFCEDIRDELGGKHSFMGVFGSALSVSKLPFTIPKLCVTVGADVAAQSAINMSFELISDSGIPTPPKFEQTISSDDEEEWSVRLNLALLGITVDKPAKLTAKFMVDDREVTSTLHIRQDGKEFVKTFSDEGVLG